MERELLRKVLRLPESDRKNLLFWLDRKNKPAALDEFIFKVCAQDALRREIQGISASNMQPHDQSDATEPSTEVCSADDFRPSTFATTSPWQDGFVILLARLVEDSEECE